MTSGALRGNARSTRWQPPRKWPHSAINYCNVSAEHKRDDRGRKSISRRECSDRTAYLPSRREHPRCRKPQHMAVDGVMTACRRWLLQRQSTSSTGGFWGTPGRASGRKLPWMRRSLPINGNTQDGGVATATQSDSPHSCANRRAAGLCPATKGKQPGAHAKGDAQRRREIGAFSAAATSASRRFHFPA